MQVVYSRPPQNADMVIREMVEKALGISPNPPGSGPGQASFPKREREEVWVVSSDREVQSHARACGAKVFGAKSFEAEMMGRTHPAFAGKGGGSPHPNPPPQGGREKPSRVRKMDVDFWLKVMSENREA